jgi:pimeloyl-ACP methyl ester carboxylesterase
MAFSHGFSVRIFLGFVLAMLTSACSLLLVMPAQAAPQAHLTSSCRDFAHLPVALGSGQPVQYSVYGQLCNPASGPSKVVLLLLHGATYDHYYWDWPNTPSHPTWSQQYSAARALNAIGYSTFNIDRIGIGPPPTLPGGPTLVGGSSQPLPGTLVDLSANAYVVHTLVLGLKSGSVNGTALGVSFRKVLLVGHSLGSYTSIMEVTSFHDVEGVVLTGYAHLINLNAPFLVTQASTDQGANGRFAGLDDHYLTTQDNTRAGAFYYATTSDPNVVAFDEQIKQTVTDAEFNQVLTIASSSPNLTTQITVPVLEILGQKDVLFCANNDPACGSDAAFAQEEAPFFPHAQLKAETVPATGHDLNLHFTAQATYGMIGGWARQHFPANI